MLRYAQVHNTYLAAYFSVASVLQILSCSIVETPVSCYFFSSSLTPIMPSLCHSFLLELHHFSNVPRMKFGRKSSKEHSQNASLGVYPFFVETISEI